MAELPASPHATTDPEERGRRQDGLQRAEAAFDPLPLDTDAARAVMSSGRNARGAPAVDFLIAATAIPAILPIYTCNGGDFLPLMDWVDVVVVWVCVPAFAGRLVGNSSRDYGTGAITEAERRHHPEAAPIRYWIRDEK